MYNITSGSISRKKLLLLLGLIVSILLFIVFYTLHSRVKQKQNTNTFSCDFVLKDGYSKEGQEFKRDIEQTEQSIALHVRRGDFAVSCIDWNGLCNVAYYEKAIAEIQKKYPNIKLFIFSDDIEWARENLKFNHPMVFVSRPALNAVEELLLMSLCKHQIIANSTFSWWGAWLNQNSEKIVVTPSVWLVAANIKTDDLLPPNWIRL